MISAIYSAMMMMKPTMSLLNYYFILRTQWRQPQFVLLLFLLRIISAISLRTLTLKYIWGNDCVVVNCGNSILIQSMSYPAQVLITTDSLIKWEVQEIVTERLDATVHMCWRPLCWEMKWNGAEEIINKCHLLSHQQTTVLLLLLPKRIENN